MGKIKPTNSSGSTRKVRPALSIEAEENQMISLAVNLAKQQLQDGTASSQVITHYLKLGSTVAKLEYDLKVKELELRAAKTKQIESTTRSEELLERALAAFRSYSGQDEPDDDY